MPFFQPVCCTLRAEPINFRGQPPGPPLLKMTRPLACSLWAGFSLVGPRDTRTTGRENPRTNHVLSSRVTKSCRKVADPDTGRRRILHGLRQKILQTTSERLKVGAKKIIQCLASQGTRVTRPKDG